MKTIIATVLTIALLSTFAPAVDAAPPPCVPGKVPILGDHCVYASFAAEEVLVPMIAKEGAIANLWEIHYKIAGQDADVYLVLPQGADFYCSEQRMSKGIECSVDSVTPLVSGSITDEGAICTGNAELIIDDGDDDPDNDYRFDLIPYARLCL